ncbi:MAG: peptidoglycan-associated lipoprotein [Desulfuromonas sp.]|nr:MAG: peptidoglycan-associated lipoprotein [Desulfuromonas sp.]
MRTFRTLQFILTVLLLGTALIACSTTPKTTMDQAQPQVTNVSSQPEVAEAGDQPVGLDGGATHEAAAGLQRIHFDFDQFVLSDEARTILDQNAQYLRANASTNVVIEGHCDERGSDEYNLALGESRAIAAKNYLNSLGISGSRISVISYGEEKPLDQAANEEAWAMNRRAEFKAVR